MPSPLDPQPNTLTCSTDDGQTWVVLPGLDMQATGPKGMFVPMAEPSAIAGDGSVLALVSGTFVAPQTEIYRLVPHASQWQSLGMMPGDDTAIQYCAGPGAGVLWATEGGGTYVAVYP